MMESLFGPLKSEYCNYFYILEIFFFVITILMAITVVRSFFTKKPMTLETSVNLIMGPLVAYFINRLYYSMCVNSL